MNDLTNFNQIYKQYNAQILNYTKFMLNNVHDAEDVTSMTFTKAWKAMEEGRFDADKSQIYTWLRNIAHRTAIDLVRTSHKDKYMSISDFQDAETGLEVFQFVDESADQNESQELKQSIKKAVSAMKPKYRVIAKLYFYNEMTYEEIANTLEIPMGSVKGMIFRVREMLQASLKQYATA
jgi:RNA polymerase sigma-70 factor (ECF subfamily)